MSTSPSGPGTNVGVLDCRQRQPVVPPISSDWEPARFPDLTADPLLFRPYTELEAGSQTWWPPNTPAPYAFLAHALQTLTLTRSRIAIMSTLTNALRILITHDPPSVLPALYLLSNCLGPPWEGIELGVGGSILSKVGSIWVPCIQSTPLITTTVPFDRLFNKRPPSLLPLCAVSTSNTATLAMSHTMQ
jgi:hypothetical protein